MKAKEFVPVDKPRNFVAKNAIKTTSGAGAHKDKKRADKQGDVKHKAKQFEQGGVGGPGQTRSSRHRSRSSTGVEVRNVK